MQYHKCESSHAGLFRPTGSSSCCFCKSLAINRWKDLDAPLIPKRTLWNWYNLLPGPAVYWMQPVSTLANPYFSRYLYFTETMKTDCSQMNQLSSLHTSPTDDVPAKVMLLCYWNSFPAWMCNIINVRILRTTEVVHICSRHHLVVYLAIGTRYHWRKQYIASHTKNNGYNWDLYRARRLLGLDIALLVAFNFGWYWLHPVRSILSGTSY